MVTASIPAILQKLSSSIIDSRRTVLPGLFLLIVIYPPPPPPILSANAQEAAADESVEVAAATEGYQLDAGDTINIRVLGEQSLSLEIEIGESGTITYPLLGEVIARGLSTSGLENRMTTRLIDEEYLVDPDISINVVEYRPFYINGEVEEPGSYPFEPGLTLRRAVSLAGGFTERASRTRITVLDNENDEIEGEDGEELLDLPVNPGYTITVSQRFF